jgi:hypothetical protein
LVRPVREQLEHDRVIRLLQSRFRRRFEVGINPGQEQNTPVGGGALATYPDLVLMSMDRGRRVQTIIEVETAESVNHLEALAQWARMARLRASFHLYVPATSVDVARRFCSDNQIPVAEVVSYHTIGDQLRFTTVYRAPADTRGAQRRAPKAAAAPGTTQRGSRARGSVRGSQARGPVRRPASRAKAALRQGRVKKTARRRK